MMFIFLDSKYLVLDHDDIFEKGAIPGKQKSLAVFDLSVDDPGKLTTIPWPSLNQSNKTPIRFICGAVSSSKPDDNDHYLAFGNDQKQVVVFKASVNGEYQLSRRFEVKRNAMKIMFVPGTDSILVMDKTGDIVEYPGGDDTKPVILLGHCSMLLDFIITDDKRFIISCDRDEKIRVTNYPKTYNIETYCLGHREFVSTVKLISPRLLVSGSGDGTVVIWDFLATNRARPIFVYDCESDESCTERFPLTRKRSDYAVRLIDLDQKNANYLFLSYYIQPFLDLFQIEEDGRILKRCYRLSTLDEPPLLISFHRNTNSLWVFGGHHEPINRYQVKQENEKTLLIRCEKQPATVEYLSKNGSFKTKIKEAGKGCQTIIQGLYKQTFFSPIMDGDGSGNNNNSKKSRMESPRSGERK